MHSYDWIPGAVVALAAEHVSVVVDNRTLGWIMFHMKDRTVNIMSPVFLDQLYTALVKIRELAGDGEIKAAAFISLHPKSFVMGADIGFMTSVTDPQEATSRSARLQALFQLASQLGVPSLCCIHGFCLGGGMELALACHERIVSSSRTTQLGLPELKLGFIPGGGGCVRLPRLIGIPAALDIILSGRFVRSPEAKRLGLVRDIVDVSAFDEHASFLTLARRWAMLWCHKGAPAAPLMQSSVLKQWVMRPMLQWQVRRRLEKKTGGFSHYPAPFMAAHMIIDGSRHSLSHALELEAHYFGKLLVCGQAKHLQWIYGNIQRLKKVEMAEEEREHHTNRLMVSMAEGKGLKEGVLGVCGGGIMGGALVVHFLRHTQCSVILWEMNAKALQAAMDRIKLQLTAAKVSQDTIRNRLQAVVSLAEMSPCDLVIEAIVEEESIKRRLFESLMQHVRADCILATNTSALSIASLAEGCPRLIGLHFFNPIDKMPLVEVVTTPQTPVSLSTFLRRFVVALQKIPILMADGPGFVVNRILVRSLTEALWCWVDGADMEALDAACVDYGMPMGPFRLMDEVGLDICQHVGVRLQKMLGERLAYPRAEIDMELQSHTLGRKTGRGYYLYQPDGKIRSVNPDLTRLVDVDNSIPIDVFRERVILAALNEAAWIVSEGIATPEDVDCAMILGAGWIPFRGGPLAQIDQQGSSHVVDRLQYFAETVSAARFEPAPALLQRREAFIPSCLQRPFLRDWATSKL
jgi:3-hydroxyacyl-CoA dehydrogenase / enoyl-CoA hydratase / 3-hydroxybutyryl-CoA epimerase